jgi:hypothetical protein
MEIGTYVIVRARDASPMAGFYAGHTGRDVALTNARRLWRWRVAGKKGVSLSDVAEHGLSRDFTRLSAVVAQVHILDACEILAATSTARTLIEGLESYEP